MSDNKGPMKKLPLLVLAGFLAIPALATDTPTKTPLADTPKAAHADQAIPAAEAKLSGPFVLKDGAISQSTTTDLAGGGRAVFTVQVAVAGNYLVQGVVDAPDENSNSFFLNIDAEPQDTMIWDLEMTSGFEERTSNWRGSGDSESNGEFVPKAFQLTAGEHKVIIGGREPAALKSIALKLAK
jgi:hypothetical protein